MDVTVLMTDSKGKIERDLDMVVEGSKKKKKGYTLSEDGIYGYEQKLSNIFSDLNSK